MSRKIVSILALVVMVVVMLPALAFGAEGVNIPYKGSLDIKVISAPSYTHDAFNCNLKLVDGGNVKLEAISNSIRYPMTEIQVYELKNGCMDRLVKTVPSDGPEKAYVEFYAEDGKEYLLNPVFDKTATPFRDAKDIWINYPGDVKVNVISGDTFKILQGAGRVIGTKSDKVVLDVTTNTSNPLDGIIVYEGDCYGGTLVENYSKISSFLADKDGKVRVEIDAKINKSYRMKPGVDKSAWTAFKLPEGKAYSFPDGIACRQPDIFRLSSEENAKIDVAADAVGVYTCSCNDRADCTSDWKTVGAYYAGDDGYVHLNLPPKAGKMYIIDTKLPSAITSLKTTVSSKTRSKVVLYSQLKTTDIETGDQIVFERYRATSKTGKYIKKHTSIKPKWTDTSVKRGKTYYYKTKVTIYRDECAPIVKTSPVITVKVPK